MSDSWYVSMSFNTRVLYFSNNLVLQMSSKHNMDFLLVFHIIFFFALFVKFVLG